MIARLEGAVIFRGEGFFILDVSGVGYKVHTTQETLRKVGKTGEKVSCWTHLVVREQALDVYGFMEMSELDFFELLITISGVGPKSALAILNKAPVDTLKKALSSKDTTYLISVSGIGKKVAEKIVVELQDKMGEGLGDSSLKEDTETMEALHALGYSSNEIREALKEAHGNTTEEKIKSALKVLGGKK